MLGEVFESLQGFCSHDFMLYIFDDEAMKSFMCKLFCLCQKLFVRLNLLKRKILCGLKDNKDNTF